LSYKRFPVTGDTTRSCSFSASFPVFESKNQLLVDSINHFILQTYFPGYAFHTKKLTEAAKALSDSFYTSYLNDFSEFGKTDFPLTYLFDLKISIPFVSDQYITLKNDNYDYMGGAHGNYSTHYYVFDVKTGKRLSVNDLVTDSIQLHQTAKTLFYRQKQLVANTSINEQGYWFEKDSFALNNNVGLQNDTLVFVFNPYEITSYSEGITELKIPLNSLK
jgi:hypothetical protein